MGMQILSMIKEDQSDCLEKLINKIKVSKLILGKNSQIRFKNHCFDPLTRKLFCESTNGDILDFNLLSVKKEFSELRKIEDDNYEKRNYSKMMNTKILVPCDEFASQEETICLSMFQSSTDKKFLIIVKKRSIYSLELFQNTNLETGSLLPNRQSSQLKLLFSLDKDSKDSKVLFSDYEIKDLQLKMGRLILKISLSYEEDLIEETSTKPFCIFLNLTLDENVVSNKKKDFVESQLVDDYELEVQRIRSFPIFKKNVTIYYLDNNNPEQIFFVIGKKIYKGYFGNRYFENLERQIQKISKFNKNEKKEAEDNFYDIVYRNKYTINAFQFSEDMTNMMITDKASRVARIDTRNGVKKMVYQVTKGEIESFRYDEESDRLFT